MGFGQRGNSWPCRPSERLGEGVYDLITRANRAIYWLYFFEQFRG